MAASDAAGHTRPVEDSALHVAADSPTLLGAERICRGLALNAVSLAQAPGLGSESVGLGTDQE